MSTEKDSILRVRLTQGSQMNWMLSLMSYNTDAGSKRYHIKHSKIRSGGVCERPYHERDGTKILLKSTPQMPQKRT